MNLEEQAASLSQEEIVELLEQNRELLRQNAELDSASTTLKDKNLKLESRNAELLRRVQWFERQVFGQRSERRPQFDARQLCLGEALEISEEPPAKEETVKQYERRSRKACWKVEGEEDLRFDPSVPVKVIKVPNPEIDGLPESEYEVIREKVTYRLAQRPGSYVVLKYVRKVVKIKGELPSPPAPPAVIERSLADVSFLAGLSVDKFCYHIPLHRQHQRLAHAGVRISRGTLTNLVHRTAELLEPIYNALLSSILQSEVLLMDETTMKAGRKAKGKMRVGYFWPIYGDKDEIAFPFAASRALKVAREALGEFCGVLVTDGYKVYERYSETVESVTHAQCWSHTRRKFIEAEQVEPALVGAALDHIGKLYSLEAEFRRKGLSPEELLAKRAEHSRPVVEEFFRKLEQTFQEQVLLPSNPFTKAVSYALEREKQLRVFLQHPGVPLDTNALERQIRPVAIGRKNYLFCWTEVGARYAGILYSLIASCRLQGVDPFVYLVDVLQRVDSHPSMDVHLLTPRLWKENFSKSPMRSDLDVKDAAD